MNTQVRRRKAIQKPTIFLVDKNFLVSPFILRTFANRHCAHPLLPNCQTLRHLASMVRRFASAISKAPSKLEWNLPVEVRIRMYEVSRCWMGWIVGNTCRGRRHGNLAASERESDTTAGNSERYEVWKRGGGV